MSNRLFYSPQYFDVEPSKPSEKPEPPVDLSKRFQNKDNAAFLAEVAKQLAKLKPGKDDLPHHAADGEMAIGLIGSYGLFGYGLRRSQEIVRFDRGPSYWSHAFLFTGGLQNDPKLLRGPDSPWLLECTLRPSATLSDALYSDGVMPRRLAEYAPAEFDWHRLASVANFAVISLGLTAEERATIRKVALEPQRARQQLGLAALAGLWFHYLSDKGEVRNPLTEGHPMHSAAYVQMAYSAAGIDLAPSASQNTVAPEFFWSLAKHLQPLNRYRHPQTNEFVQRPLKIWTCIRDPYCTMTGTDAAQSQAQPPTLESIIKG
ncbi:hypothetical protein ACIPL1_21495 [Pseudomonas sp. NPDC090202]|uniref:hypothetical protein n=1 Tax=unclassified Pseudomonas TaxID=196821 RepID=UPI0038145A93